MEHAQNYGSRRLRGGIDEGTLGKQNRRKGRRQQTPAPQEMAKPIVIPPVADRSPLRRLIDRFQSMGRHLTTPLGIAASIATIVAVVIAALQYQPAGNLLVSIGKDAPLNDDRPTYFFFSMPQDAYYARYVLPVDLELTNTSSTHDDEVRMILSYDRKYLRAELPLEAMRHDPRRPPGEQRHDISRARTHDYVKFSTTFLPPKARGPT